MNARFVISAAVLAMAAGCAAPTQTATSFPPIELAVQFDAAQARALMADGVNMIKGNAFMRQRGGGVVTCAGATVYLIPATEYAKRRFTVLYGTSGDSGTNSHRRDIKFSPDPAEYYSLSKSTRCDAQGNFTFDRIADGEFYVQTMVAWEVAGRLNGGNLMHRVRVTNGSISNIVLSS